MISQNSVIVVRTPVTSVCRSWLMSLTITFVFGPPKLQMKPASGATDARRKPAQLAVPKLRVEGVSYASTSVGPATVGGGCNATSSVLASSSESDVLITGPPYGWSAAIALPGDLERQLRKRVPAIADRSQFLGEGAHRIGVVIGGHPCAHQRGFADEL
jgi:hypothetical protein